LPPAATRSARPLSEAIFSSTFKFTRYLRQKDGLGLVAATCTGSRFGQFGRWRTGQSKCSGSIL
jgi:hypothetical protein